jgi:hypothetical protein
MGKFEEQGEDYNENNEDGENNDIWQQLMD